MKWYAVEIDRDDNDWSYGSYKLETAKEMLKNFPDGLIAVIEDNECKYEITYQEVYGG